MNRYQYYKNVPETWIGDIPVHWKISLVSRHFNIGRGRVISKVEIFENKGDFPVYSSQTTNNGELGKINTYDFDGEYVTWTTDGANTGTCFHRNGKFNTTNVCGMLSKRNILFELKYLCFYLNLVTKPYVRIDINPKLMNNMMGGIPLIVPPIFEQQQIVSFLDDKTQKIYSLIQQKEKKIELLKEKRTSLINHVVTKGVNPNVEMKDSGVEWIGEIPSHWNTSKLKYHGNFFSGYSFDSNDFQNEGEVRVIKISNIQNNGVSWEDLSFLPKNYYDDFEGFRVLKGDLIFVLTRPIISTGIKVCFYQEEHLTLLNQRNSVFRPDVDTLVKRFLFFLVRTFYFFEEFKQQLKGSGQPNISTEQISNIKIYLPSLKEQQQIVEYLDKQTEEIDTLIQLEQKKIDTLKEYRQSLISEVVTGKIRVCEEDNSLILNSQTV